MSGVTSGLTVVELGAGLAPSYGAKLLADHGSEVIKVEPPDGDPLRAAGPFRDDRPTVDGGGLFTFLNTSKHSVTVDGRAPEGREVIGRLIERADVVVHSLTGDARAGLGLGTAARDEAGLVEVAVTPYGLDGPYRDFGREPITLAALSGWMFCMGDEDRPPLFPGGPYIEYLAGISAAAGALIAVGARARTGVGQVVDVSEYEVGVEALVFDPSRYSYAGTHRTRTGELYGGDPLAAVYPCADGYFQFHAGRQARALLRIIGGDELADDERFRTARSRLDHQDALRRALIDGLADKRRWELFERCGQEHIVVGAVPDMADLLELPPHRERRYFHRLPTGPLSGVPVPGPPVRFGDGEWRSEAAPALGGSNGAVLSPRSAPVAGERGTGPAGDGRGAGPGRSDGALTDGALGDGALSGLRVVEIAQGWAGPLVGAMLADFGAEVIKVESTRRLDWWRDAAAEPGPMIHERSALFNGINRNKRDVTLDLQSAEGRALLLRLVRDADVFVENFTSHVVHKLALTHDVLADGNPGLISVSMPAFGSTGPWRDFPALGTSVESMCGVQSVTGYEDGPPRLQGTSWDPVIGLYAAFAVTAALHHRRRTGRGQHIEVSHIEAGTHLVAGPLLERLLTGRRPRRMGNANAAYAPHGCYPAAGRDQWITVAAPTDRQWDALVHVLDDDPALRDPDYATPSGRLDRRAALDAAIAALTAGRDRDELFRALQAAGVPAAPVFTPPDLLVDGHLRARGFWAEVERDHVGTHPYPSRFLTMSRTPPVYSRPAPTLGQDNRFVLSDRLGLSADEVADLEGRGITGTVPQAASGGGWART